MKRCRIHTILAEWCSIIKICGRQNLLPERLQGIMLEVKGQPVVVYFLKFEGPGLLLTTLRLYGSSNGIDSAQSIVVRSNSFVLLVLPKLKPGIFVETIHIFWF
jgi:hypothetical protein